MHLLNETEQQALVARYCHIPVCLTDVDLRITWASDDFCVLTGYSALFIKGKTLDQILCANQEQRDALHHLISGLLHSEAVSDEFTASNRDQEPLLLALRMQEAMHTQHGLTGYVIEFQNRTLLRQQEKEIQQNRRELSEMFELSVMPMCYSEPNGRFFKVNKAFCELFECQPEELIGRDYLDVNFGHLTPEGKEELRREAFEFWLSNRVFRKTIETRTLKGNLRFVEVVMKNVRIADKALISVYLIDKTEKRDFESKILEQNERLKEFAFLTSHKLRQPLANILGLIELVKSEAQSEKDVTFNFETLRILTSQLDDVVHQMNDALTELDMEAEKSHFFNQQEEVRIHDIWIVDDDQVITYITQRLLLNADPNLEITGFLSAKMALEKLRIDGQVPDVLLLDINMPGISGWEFLDALSQTTNEVNVYMYSSSIDPEDVKRARSYSMVKEFLSKPLDMKTIRGLLDVPLRRRKVS